ncbi:MAG: hypothetical protein HDS78_03230 [Bacteroidales bacterium]|nr:hypothetical protein [Bacteroidales bacterium]
MKTVTIKFNKNFVSTISTTNLRKNFPDVCRSIFKRIQSGNIIFTREVESLSGEVVTEPYIILTKSNKVFEIKECGAHFYLELIGDENEGIALRSKYYQVRYDTRKCRRKLMKQEVALPDPKSEEQFIKFGAESLNVA